MSKRNPADNDPAETVLTAKKLATAWKRLRATLEEFGRQKGRHLLVTMCSENAIRLRQKQSHCHVTLIFQGTTIAREMGDVRDVIQLVKIRPNGVAYRLAGAVCTAMRLALELLSQYQRCSGYAIAQEAAPTVDPPSPSPRVSEIQRTPEAIVRLLRRITLEMAAGARLEATCRKLGISETTFCQWHDEYSGLDIRFAKRLTLLQKENEGLRKQIAELKSFEQTDWKRDGHTRATRKVVLNGHSAVPPRSAVRGSCE